MEGGEVVEEEVEGGEDLSFDVMGEIAEDELAEPQGDLETRPQDDEPEA
jgi:hypothetical protein